jgi:hypothetical protein
VTDADYDTWVAHYCALFQLTAEADLVMLSKWKPLLAPFELRDMVDAANEVAQNQSQLFRTEHLRLFTSFARRRQAEAARRRADAENRAHELSCQVCRGTGVVCVPHPAFVKNGEWLPYGLSYITAAVSCDCNRGRAMKATIDTSQAKREKGQSILSLMAYEVINPYWVDHLAERVQKDRNALAAIQAAESADKAGRVRRLAAKLAERFKAPK